MIKQEFLDSLKHYSADDTQHLKMWSEAEKNYSRSDRHYHNITHLNTLLSELKPFEKKFSSWDIIVFAIVYHDIIYNTLKNNNEERSAALAVKRLSGISSPQNLIASCERMILATKKHEPADFETNLFTDADLSILGSDAETYKVYAAQIRREYSIYPDLIYYPGRKKVLARFLSMDRIYKSEEFSARYEQSARVNLQAELDLLNDET
jgi:predicted metal-dependent HD superfamily phosphohydrolase